MMVTTSLAKAFSFTFNAPLKTGILRCSGDLSNQKIGSIAYRPNSKEKLGIVIAVKATAPVRRASEAVYGRRAQRGP